MMSTFTKRKIRPIIIERETLLTWFDTNYLMHRQLSCFGNSTFETLNHKSAGKILTTVYIVQIPYILVLCGYHCHGGLLVVECQQCRSKIMSNSKEPSSSRGGNLSNLVQHGWAFLWALGFQIFWTFACNWVV